ncbi:hypothetical protein [Kitasatospora viridis]|uniref:PknH-like protein n=1 Tax=Kitasatospora viridis TaxID=281105 RepID=A0A561UJS5_9ACTN|nr:hypothetical protein [Kitasatospora viridis]TWF99585.1 hypothetical protein FHX73_113432 [Kitasatospora viridis]
MPLCPRPLLPALLALPLLLAGCATVRPGPAGDAAGASATASAGRVLTAAELRAAAVTAADLGGGYTVSLLPAGQGGPPAGAVQRRVSDVPACQPVLDAIGPGDPAAAPAAESDLTLTRTAAPRTALYVGLLGYPAGRAAALQSMLDQVLAQCASFTSGVPGVPGRTHHQLARAEQPSGDTPTDGGADALTGFTLLSGDGAGALSQRAEVARVGTVLAVFSTVGTAKEPAGAPDPAAVRAQTRRLRAAQG